MSQSETDKKEVTEAMKRLRENRKETIKKAAAKIKTQRKVFQTIEEQLKENPQTVPEIAGKTNLSTSETLWCLAAMKKYGRIKEGEKDGSYFKYELTEPEA
jgi:predicted Rossmann fold nucleotide-binding protein DprA/Smf involved in DNA uptake